MTQEAFGSLVRHNHNAFAKHEFPNFVMPNLIGASHGTAV